MTEEIVHEYDRGDTSESRCDVTIYNDSTGAYDLVDADSTYPKITIYDPSGVALVTAQSMTKISTGKYVYRYDIAATATIGWCSVKHEKVVTSGGVTRHDIEWTGFTVK